MTHDRAVSSVQPVGVAPSIPTPPASFFLSVIPGAVGRGVAGLQAIARGGALYTHSGLYIGNGNVIQAEPSGTKVRRFPDRYTSGPVLWSDAPIRRYMAANPDTDEVSLRLRVVEAALDMVGAGYAWLDYLVIGAAEWGVPGWGKLRRRVDGTGRLLCSSLVDRAYANAGVHLFRDGRPVGQVSPADLFRYDEAYVRERLVDLERRVSDIEERLA